MKKITILGIACCDLIVKPVNQLPNHGELSLVNSIEMYTGLSLTFSIASAKPFVLYFV